MIINLALKGIIYIQYVFQALGHMNDQKWYDCGKDLGTLLNMAVN
jgi:hypothetical protein